MIKSEIRPEDLAELRRDLKALEPKNLLRGKFNPLGKDIVKEVKPYPPPVDTSRTGRLGRSWYYQTWGMNLEVKNYAHYAGWVQGEDQTTQHRNTGWKRLFEVAETQVDKMIAKISKEIDRIWRT